MRNCSPLLTVCWVCRSVKDVNSILNQDFPYSLRTSYNRSLIHLTQIVWRWQGLQWVLDFQPTMLSDISDNNVSRVSEQNGISLQWYIIEIYTGLPTCPYLTVLVGKSASSTYVCPYFSKYRHRFSRKYGHCDVNECKFVASEVDRRVLMGSYYSFTYAYFEPLYITGSDW